MLFSPQNMNVLWLDSPFFEEILSKLALESKTVEQIQSFAKEGFLVLEPVVESELISNVVESLQGKYTDSATGYTEKTRVLNAWTFNNAVKEIANLPKIHHLLSVLHQRQPIPFQTLNFEKGSQQKTHSDAIHFHSVPHGFMCGVWIALEDIDSENGPLFYYPGSHKLKVYEMHDLGLPSSFAHYQAYEDFIERLICVKGLKKREVHLKKGQAVIWAANLLHGGCKIKDPKRTRLSQVTHYYFENCMYYAPCASDPFIGKMMLKKVINISTGKKVAHLYNGKKPNVFKLKPRKSLKEWKQAIKRRLGLGQR